MNTGHAARKENFCKKWNEKYVSRIQILYSRLVSCAVCLQHQFASDSSNRLQCEGCNVTESSTQKSGHRTQAVFRYTTGCSTGKQKMWCCTVLWTKNTIERTTRQTHPRSIIFHVAGAGLDSFLLLWWALSQFVDWTITCRRSDAIT